MLDAARELSGAGGVCTAHRALSFLAEDRLTAGGAYRRHVKFALTAVALFGVGAYHLGYNVARLIDFQ